MSHFVWGASVASGIEVINPDSSYRKEWKHLERGKKVVRYFTVRYVSEIDLSPGHINCNSLSNAVAGGNLASSQKNPIPTDYFPIVMFAIENGEIFELGGPTGNLPDKREVPLRRIIPSSVTKVGSKKPERIQGSEQVFDPFDPLSVVLTII
jgi:hypothetical protein